MFRFLGNLINLMINKSMNIFRRKKLKFRENLKKNFFIKKIQKIKLVNFTSHLNQIFYVNFKNILAKQNKGWYRQVSCLSI